MATRKPPRRRTPKAKAEVKHSTTVRKGSRGKVVHHEDHMDVVEVDVEPGEAGVNVGFDKKFWASDSNHGMTIGVSTYVKLSCRQSAGALAVANDVAAELAYSFLQKNAVRVQRDLNDFIDG